MSFGKHRDSQLAGPKEGESHAAVRRGGGEAARKGRGFSIVKSAHRQRERFQEKRKEKNKGRGMLISLSQAR